MLGHDPANTATSFEVLSKRNRTGSLRYQDINRRPTARELQHAVAAAQAAGLRVDTRWL